MLTSLIIAITSIAYLVGMLFTVRHTNLMVETAKRRGHPKKRINHAWDCDTRYGYQSCDCFRAKFQLILTNEYGFIRPWLKGTTWPLILGSKVVFVALKPLGMASGMGVKSLRAWLHPEPEIPDQEKINQMHKELGIKD